MAALITQITSWLDDVLGEIIDDKTNTLQGSELTDRFVTRFGSDVEGVSALSDKLGLPPLAENLSRSKTGTRGQARLTELSDEYADDGFTKLDNFFDFLRGATKVLLTRGRAEGWIVLSTVTSSRLLPIIVQSIEIDNTINDLTDSGISDGDEASKNLLLSFAVTQTLGLPMGYEPSTIVVKAIIPNGANTAPHVKLASLWRMHMSSDDFLRDVACVPLLETIGNQFAGVRWVKSWNIWNPIINASGIERVKMRRLNPASTVTHDAITVNITFREDIMGAFFEKLAESQGRACPRRKSALDAFFNTTARIQAANDFDAEAVATLFEHIGGSR